MATEAGPGKLRAGGQTLKELESGMAAWEQGAGPVLPTANYSPEPCAALKRAGV